MSTNGDLYERELKSILSGDGKVIEKMIKTFSEEDAAKLVPGTKVKISGTKATFNGEIEVADGTFELGNNPADINNPYNGAFPVEISDDKNTLVIKGVDNGGQMCYPAIGYWNWGWLFYSVSTCQDIVLTRAEGNESEGAEVTRAAKLDLNKVADVRNCNNRITQNLFLDGIEQREAILVECTRDEINLFDNNIIWNVEGRFNPDDVKYISGSATWYALVRLSVAVNSLEELRSQGQQFYSVDWAYPSGLQQGARGDKVRHLQYMLSVLSEYIPRIPEVEVDGIFGPATRTAVLAAQGYFGLPQTGVVDEDTWDDLYDQFAGIENQSLRSEVTFPGMEGTTKRQFPGDGIRPGNQDPVRQEVVR